MASVLCLQTLLTAVCCALFDCSDCSQQSSLSLHSVFGHSAQTSSDVVIDQPQCQGKLLRRASLCASTNEFPLRIEGERPIAYPDSCEEVSYDELTSFEAVHEDDTAELSQLQSSLK